MGWNGSFDFELALLVEIDGKWRLMRWNGFAGRQMVTAVVKE